MDQDTFANLWFQTKPAVEAFLVSLVHDHIEVDDLAQEVAMAVFQQIDRYDEARAFTPWAIAIARNKAFEHLRRRSVRHRAMSLASMDHIANAAVSLESEFGARVRFLEACLEELPERSSRLIRLHYGEDLDQASIAEQNGLTLANVKVMLHRIRNALRNCVEKRLSTDGIA